MTSEAIEGLTTTIQSSFDSFSGWLPAFGCCTECGTEIVFPQTLGLVYIGLASRDRLRRKLLARI